MNIDSANDILLIHTPGYRNMRTIGKFAIAAFVLFFLTTTGNARHIIGGVMTYRCISPGNYEFTLKMYRDCNCTDCANFDPTAFVGVYRCPGGNCSGQSQGAPFRRVDVPLGSVRQVTAPSYPCLIPPNVCVQEAEYVFNLSLPVSTTDSYHITYQRCCRNETINNIFAPSTVGATYTVEITSAAQQLCNNSPTFNTFPPTVICGGLPLSYDHAATDADGDSLVYRFSAPLLGGGNLLTSPAYQTCAGAYPNPGCPPPYNPVSFIVPTYTPTAPMAGNPVVTIDSQTGLISGTPVNLGQYVVGVQVLEYRNGVLLSTVFRDFQFNVARCDPTVVAQIQSDSIADGQSYFINACGDTAVTIVNTSFQQAFASAQQAAQQTAQVHRRAAGVIALQGVEQRRGAVGLLGVVPQRPDQHRQRGGNGVAGGIGVGTDLLRDRAQRGALQLTHQVVNERAVHGLGPWSRVRKKGAS